MKDEERQYITIDCGSVENFEYLINQAKQEEREKRDEMLDSLKKYLTTEGKVYFATVIDNKRTYEKLKEL